MTKTEFEWVQNAVQMLDEGEVSEAQEAKILRAIAQIFTRAADQAEARMWQKIEDRLWNNPSIQSDIGCEFD